MLINHKQTKFLKKLILQKGDIMNYKKIITFSFIIAVITINISCGKKTPFEGGEWVAKINNDVITINMMNAFYYAQQKQIYNQSNEEIDKMANDPDSVAKNPTLNKTEFLENFIRQRLVYNKAVDDGILSDPEVKAHIEMAKEAVVVAQYVKTKFKGDTEPSEEEIAEMYSKNRARFKGVPIEQAEQYIQQQLFQQKLQMKLRELVENLKEQSIIEKNLALLQGNADKKEEKAEGDKKQEQKAAEKPAKKGK